MPKKFIMNHNSIAEVTSFFEILAQNNDKEVTINCSNIQQIDEASLLVLLAITEREHIAKAKVIYFAQFSELDKLLAKYGFQVRNDFSYKMFVWLPKPIKDIYSDLISDEEYQDIYKKIGKYIPIVHPDFAFIKNKDFKFSSNIDVKFITNLTLELKAISIPEIYQPLYDLLIELVGNAAEHGIMKKNINWWMHRYKDPNQTNMHYVFVDMGGGIVNSYKNQGFINQSDTEEYMILDAFEGKLGSTTKEPGRGNGLPLIWENVQKGWISDFFLVTNHISLQYKNGEYTVKRISNFAGTYYSWTINKHNFITWKNSL
jgi:ABC-type transporter Mla MlaB component